MALSFLFHRKRAGSRAEPVPRRDSQALSLI
jgi:hypothetical protein